jgi:hypothetical protein
VKATFDREHALDVAEPTASVICQRIREGLADLEGTELHGELSVLIFTALRVYFETYEFKFPPLR